MSDNHVISKKEYLSFLIKWGRITNWMELVLCFLLPLCLIGVGLMPPFSAILSGFLVVTSALVRGAHFLFSDHRRGRDIHGLRLRQHQQPPHPRVMPAKRWMGAWDGQGQHCRHAGHDRFYHRQHHPCCGYLRGHTNAPAVPRSSPMPSNYCCLPCSPPCPSSSRFPSSSPWACARALSPVSPLRLLLSFL